MKEKSYAQHTVTCDKPLAGTTDGSKRLLPALVLGAPSRGYCVHILTINVDGSENQRELRPTTTKMTFLKLLSSFQSCVVCRLSTINQICVESLRQSSVREAVELMTSDVRENRI